MLTRIDHVGIAVADLDTSLEHYRRTLGVEPVHREKVESQGVEEILLEVSGSFIQLLGALGPDTAVGRFLQRRGPGVHHVGFRVDDVAQTLAHLKAEGVRLIDDAPKPGSRGTATAFVHPSGMGGVLVELVEERG